MATFAIGDVHGCLKTLERLLGRLDFDQARDRLWLTGDLVNRGPDSLEVLRWARRTERELGDRFVAVLGNHDLHAVAVVRGMSTVKRKDTLDELLSANDMDDLAGWLLRRPLLHREQPYVLVHAGVLPQWTVEQTMALANRVATALEESGRGERLLLRAGAGADTSDPLWQALAVLTRVRTVTHEGSLCSFTGPPEEAPVGCVPWFDHPGRSSRDETFIVGHWAAMGLRRQKGLLALDSGCAWGGPLSAVRLDDGAVFQQKNLDL